MKSGSNMNDGAMAPEAWRDALLANLDQRGGACRRTAKYIAGHNVAIGFSKQSTGARWTMDGRIELNDKHYSLKTNPALPYLLSIVVHEATHLEQGVRLALSVEGEYLAWKRQIEVLRDMRVPLSNKYWGIIEQLPDLPAKRDLILARSLMMKATKWTYLIWLLPFRPSRTYAAVVGGLGKLYDRSRR